MSNLSGGQLSPVQTKSLWSWNTSGSIPVVSGYPQGPGVFTPTKTGLTPTDVQNFVGVPLVYYGTPTSTPMASGDILQAIRYAEDEVQEQTSILLCQTWVAAAPAPTPQVTQNLGLLVNTASGFQIPGYDYDLRDSAYDFMFKNAQDEGWMAMTLRYRPLQAISYTATDYTAVKNTAFYYPLQNVYFRIPTNWNVEDADYGYIRYVPATNVQMLPLFAMQLAFMGFAENVPAGIWLQYTAGLTPYDYQTRWSFMKKLVLCKAAITVLSMCEGTINLGAMQVDTMVDGLRQQTKYDPNGPYAGLIRNFGKQAAQLMTMARSKVSGPMMTFL